MKKYLLMFVYFVCLFFVISSVTFAQDIFYAKSSLITDKVDTIFKVVEYNDKLMTISTESTYDSETSERNYYLYLLVFSKNTNELEKKVLISESTLSFYKESIDFMKINDNEAFIVYGDGVVKINLNDYSIVLKNDNIYADRIKRIDDKFLLYYGSTLYIVDENLSILYTSTKYDVDDADVVDSNIYILDESYTKDDNSIYHYQYNIYTLDDKLELVSEKNYKYEDDTKSMEWGYGAIGEFLKNEDEYYYVSHIISRFNSDGTVEDISGDVYPQENGIDYSMIQKYDSYFIVAGYKIENGITNSFVEIFDTDFNLLQEIDINELCGKNIEEGLSVVKTITLTDKGFYANGVFRDASLDIEEGFSVQFLLYYDIEVKTDGNGKVEVANTSKADENVVFNLTPNEGYVLSNVKVTDKDGNVIEFKENSFTMPSVDVIIDATFVKEENPDTSDNGIVLLVTIIAISGIILSSNIKKTRYYN